MSSSLSHCFKKKKWPHIYLLFIFICKMGIKDRFPIFLNVFFTNTHMINYPRKRFLSPYMVLLLEMRSMFFSLFSSWRWQTGKSEAGVMLNCYDFSQKLFFNVIFFFFSSFSSPVLIIYVLFYCIYDFLIKVGKLNKYYNAIE